MYNSEMNRSEKPDTLASPNFVEGRGKSITAAVTGAKVGWLGSTTEPLLVVDTPGTDDTFNALEDDDEKLARFAHGRAQDFCVKLRAVEKVNAFLVLIGDDLRAVDAAKILKALRASFDGSVDEARMSLQIGLNTILISLSAMPTMIIFFPKLLAKFGILLVGVGATCCFGACIFASLGFAWIAFGPATAGNG